MKNDTHLDAFNQEMLAIVRSLVPATVSVVINEQGNWRVGEGRNTAFATPYIDGLVMPVYPLFGDDEDEGEGGVYPRMRMPSRDLGARNAAAAYVANVLPLLRVHPRDWTQPK